MEVFSDEFCSDLVSFEGFEFLLVEVLQVCGLGDDEEFVDVCQLNVFDSTEADSETDIAEEVEGFFGADKASVLHGAQSAKDFVVEEGGFFVEELLSGLSFVFDDGIDGLVDEIVDDLFFGFTECGLV